MQAASQPVPLSLLTGFLGSGKTTLLNRLLRDPAIEPTLVIVNEFGSIPIDNLLIDFVDPNTVVTSNGCICCAAPSDLTSSLSRFLRDRTAGLRRFERIVIETSGLADPIPTLTTVMQDPALLGRLRLDSVIVTVDAINGGAQLARFVEARRQLAVADRIVLTKHDLASPEEAAQSTAALRACNPAAPIIAAEAGCAALFGAGLWNPATRQLEPSRWLQADAYAPASGKAFHTSRVASASTALAAPLRWDDFHAWVEALRDHHAAHLLRLKGLLFTRESAQPLAVHAIHTVFHPPMPILRPLGGSRDSLIVLIVQDIDPEILLDDLRRRCAGSADLAGLASLARRGLG